MESGFACRINRREWGIPEGQSITISVGDKNYVLEAFTNEVRVNKVAKQALQDVVELISALNLTEDYVSSPRRAAV